MSENKNELSPSYSSKESEALVVVKDQLPIKNEELETILSKDGMKDKQIIVINHPAEQPPAKKGSIVMQALIFLVLLIIAGEFAYSYYHPVSSVLTKGDTASPLTLPATTPLVVAGVGNATQTETLHGVTLNVVHQKFTEAQTDIQVEVINKGEGSAYLMASNFTLIDDLGRVYDLKPFKGDIPAGMWGSGIPVEGKSQAVLSFAPVASDAKTLTLALNPVTDMVHSGWNYALTFPVPK